MPVIDSEVLCHKLSIKVDAKQVKQMLRRMNKEKGHVISDEVDHTTSSWLHQGDILP